MDTDETFGEPFFDVDEWRESPRRHRYVHGGFAGTHTRFSFYFPPAELYRGRMFQFLSGGAGGDENALTSGSALELDWAFDTVFDELGGYLIESNQGHFGNEGRTGLSEDIELFVASAETGRYSKDVAEEFYGAAPHHSYVWGGSGGGLRSICCIENRPDVWDGAIPFVIGEVSSQSLQMTLAYWWLHCRDRLVDIVDATEPGGSGDPFATLADDERFALATVYRGGWNRGAETQLWASASWMFGMERLRNNDPDYFGDFWTKPGYLGYDHPDRLAGLLVDQRCHVTRVQSGPDGPGQMWLPAIPPASGTSEQPDKGWSYGIEVDADLGSDQYRHFMAKVTVLTGQAKGRVVYVARDGNVLLGERMTSPDMFDGVEPGDEIRLDNQELIAWAHRWMHAVDLERWTVDDPTTGERTLAPEFAGFASVIVDGTPIYPQRRGKSVAAVQTGVFNRKVIHVSCTHDTIVPPTSVGHYHRMVADHHGGQTNEFYRLWWVENAPHAAAELLLTWTTPEKNPGIWRSRLVGYDGAIREALESMVRWVEEGLNPAPSTSYRFTPDSGLVLASSALERGGVQAVVVAQANGGPRADVKVGETVTFTGTATQPPGTGSIVFASWDFEGVGDFSHQNTLVGDASSIKVEATHVYQRPGTYFASFRAGGHRNGRDGHGLPVENGARVRVVVSQS
jgi:hypothetical protein